MSVRDDDLDNRELTDGLREMERADILMEGEKERLMDGRTDLLGDLLITGAIAKSALGDTDGDAVEEGNSALLKREAEVPVVVVPESRVLALDAAAAKRQKR